MTLRKLSGTFCHGTCGDREIECHQCQSISTQPCSRGQVPEHTPLAPSMKGEIGAYGWFPIDQLPDSYDANQQGYRSAEGTRHHFHNVWQFIGRLKRWIRRAQGKPSAKNAGRKNGKGKPTKTNGQATEPSMHSTSKLVRSSSNHGSHANGSSRHVHPSSQANGSTAQIHLVHPTTSTAASQVQNPSAGQLLRMNGSSSDLPSSSSSDSQASVLSHAQLPPQLPHPWLSFKLNASQILDQLK